MADAITGSTQLSPAQQDAIAAIVQRELISAAVLGGTVRDVSNLAVPGNKSITIPRLSSFSITNRASGAQGDAVVLSADGDQMNLDQNAYVAWILDSKDETQTTFDFQSEAAERAASAHGVYVDNQIISEMETVGVEVSSGTTGDITKQIVLDMRKDLLNRKARRNDLFLAVSPDQEAALLAINEFVEADRYGSAIIPNGVLGRLYGVNVVITAELAAQQYFMYERGGVALGFQKGPQMEEQGANEFGVGARRVAMDQLFGVKGMQIEEQGVAAGESALVVKDANV
jgi:hypothetical protein